jgi:F0F1-type ATP synthase epsilon subunit
MARVTPLVVQHPPQNENHSDQRSTSPGLEDLRSQQPPNPWDRVEKRLSILEEQMSENKVNVSRALVLLENIATSMGCLDITNAGVSVTAGRARLSKLSTVRRATAAFDQQQSVGTAQQREESIQAEQVVPMRKSLSYVAEAKEHLKGLATESSRAWKNKKKEIFSPPLQTPPTPTKQWSFSMASIPREDEFQVLKGPKILMVRHPFMLDPAGTKRMW